MRGVVDEVFSPAAAAAMRTLDFLRGRKRHYQLTFNSPSGKAVLQDLVRFCRVTETSLVPGHPDISAALEGRREVFLRITQHLGLTSDELYVLYTGKQPPTAGE